MQQMTRKKALCAALREQMTVTATAMRRLGLDENAVFDSTSQARAALEAARDPYAPCPEATLLEAIGAQVRASMIVLRELGSSVREIENGTRHGTSALHAP